MPIWFRLFDADSTGSDLTTLCKLTRSSRPRLQKSSGSSRINFSVFVTKTTEFQFSVVPVLNDLPESLRNRNSSVLRIRDVYPGSDLFPSQIPDSKFFKFPDPHQM
jgi:hypothetical protein